MNPFASNDEKARKALEAAVSRHALAVADAEAHRLSPADPGDFDACKTSASRDAELDRDVEIAARVVEHWRGVVAKFEAEAADRAANAEYAEMERLAASAAKRVKALFDLYEKAASETAWLDEHVRTVAQYNDRRGSRPPIVDGERRVRTIPGRTVPATFRDEIQWLDGAGNRPSSYHKDAAGELVPIEQGYTRQKVRVQVSAEQFYPDQMPRRAADAIELHGLDGKRLWPR